MESKSFTLMFMSACQQGQLSRLLELQTDWKEVMEILLVCLDASPTNKVEVEKRGSEKLEQWALTTQEGEDELELKVRVMISEKRYYQADSLKSFKLIINNSKFKTVVMFNVRRKKVMVRTSPAWRYPGGSSWTWRLPTYRDSWRVM